ncbi:GntR family transcriptional regulator [Aeromonas jandaei]
MRDKNFVDIARERFKEWLQKESFAPGGRLPSERELCELIDAKRMTLRQVLKELEVESVIFRKNRSGWFISPERFRYNPKSFSSFDAEARSQGRIPFWGYLEKAFVPVKEKKTFYYDRYTYRVTGWCGLDGHKVFYHESFIDADAAPGFTSKLNDQSFASVWKNGFGHELTIKKLVFKPVKMPEMACKELGVSPSSFGILVEKHRATCDNIVVHIDFEYWRHDSVELVINQ